MINTDFSPENQDDYDGNFTVSGDDDTAFFNMNLCGLQDGINSQQNSNQKSSNYQFGGLNLNGFNKKNDTIVVPNQTVDPSASCNHNCQSCMWSGFCNKMTKGLIALGSSGSAMPKLG